MVQRSPIVIDGGGVELKQLTYFVIVAEELSLDPPRRFPGLLILVPACGW